MSTSATGGYLLPSSTGADLNDQALNRLLQQLVVNLTGLPGNLVFPRWQEEPPNIPDFGVNWAAVGRTRRSRDSFSAVIHNHTADSSSTVIRNEVIDVLASFYGPAAEANSELLAMGIEIGQNRETIGLQNYQFIGGAGDSVIAPALLKNRWTYKVDISFRLRHQQQYTYSILDLAGVQGTLNVKDGALPLITEPISDTNID